MPAPARCRGQQRHRDVGTGVLRYLDCNNAELRVGVDGGDRRTLRLRRSREVTSCSALIQ